MEQVGCDVHQWIEEERNLKCGEATVERVMPMRFEKYVKVMNPIHVDKIAPKALTFWSDHDPNDDPTFGLGERQTYKEVCEKYGGPYTKDISTAFIDQTLGGIPRELVMPEEGEVEEWVLPKLLGILRHHTEGLVYFHYELNSLNFGYVGEGLCFSGELDEVNDFKKNQQVAGSPTYWWPEDRQYCVFVDIDLDYTLISGNLRLIQDLLDSKDLEVMEVERNTKL
ncbi:hypothetical protein LCM20_01520 [Halobacillus litoralis]|uniref:hypothetical protein n=1 Tax=Halobacillus litoralis TaxID=45668 RepID=UPI001CD5FC73|nr:hypothetical protein [Halobacillus litoralis]MCA0969265.1 hypothetical protein [Halobacillus litoralis]